MNFRPINFRGSSHLAYTSIADGFLGLYHCSHKILNSSYAIVAEFTTLHSGVTVDPHEFEVSDDGERYIQAATITRPVAANIAAVSEQAAFQEIDISSGRVLSEWLSLEHVPSNQTCVMLPTSEDYL